MKRLVACSLAAGAIVAVAGPLVAQQGTGPARIMYPKDYDKNFVLYNVTDRFDGKHTRFLYIDKASAAKVKAGEPLPDGIVVVMELRAVEMDAAGNPVLDENGRMKPTPKVNAVMVQEKRKGWGDAIAPNLRNGDWDYAAFKPDGTVNTEAKLEPCFACHLSRKDRDFTFTTFKNVADGWKP
jgi:hypothetical protein